MTISNDEIAMALERIAELLAAQGADGFRVRAYRTAARSVRAQASPLRELLEAEGRKGLEALPGLGRRCSALVAELLLTGRCALLDRLEGQVTPEELFATVPGIGPKLAARLHRELEVDTLEELELAAHDGRLEALPGLGERRCHALRAVLAEILESGSRRRTRRWRGQEGVSPEAAAPSPGVELLLAVDAEYRRRARAGELRRIAPRRFNPSSEAWLPILHTEREGFAFTALYSNTARAHELGRSRDWVVLYWERDGHESQCTVVTETRGALAGHRVVRGREPACRVFYEGQTRAAVNLRSRQLGPEGTGSRLRPGAARGERRPRPAASAP